MNNAPVKAIAVFDRTRSSWFAEQIIDDRSIDCHLIDVEEFVADIEQFDSALETLETKNLDAVLFDSILPSAFLTKMVMRVHDRAPNVPILLLPQINVEIDAARILETSLHSSFGTTADRVMKVIRYARNRQRLQKKLLEFALKDDLTGLHNRRGFQALAKQHLKLARSMKRQLLMFFADVDGLKQINDRFGHREGDHALQRTAASFKKTFRRSDVTARLGGDEFIALIIEDPERTEKTIKRRLQLNLYRRTAKKTPYHLSLSIGVARFDPQDATSLEDLMAQADKALYAQKRKGLIVGEPSAAISPADIGLRPKQNDRKPSAHYLIGVARDTPPASEHSQAFA